MRGLHFGHCQGGEIIGLETNQQQDEGQEARPERPAPESGDGDATRSTDSEGATGQDEAPYG